MAVRSTTVICWTVTCLVALCLPLCSADFLWLSTFSDAACIVPLSNVPYAVNVSALDSGSTSSACQTTAGSSLAQRGILSYQLQCGLYNASGLMVPFFSLNMYTAAACSGANFTYNYGAQDRSGTHNSTTCMDVGSVVLVDGALDSTPTVYGQYMVSATNDNAAPALLSASTWHSMLVVLVSLYSIGSML